MLTGADLLIDCLFRHGVRCIFGMPGSHSTHIYDAIHRHGGIKTILCRNEQAGAFMADGYARVTGEPGIVCTTAGPGATNALTGVAEAYADSVPALLITGQVNHDRIHEECGRYHEIDLEGIFRPCTRYSATVMRNQDLPGAVTKAFNAMLTGRPGPAALILPQDLMALPVEAVATEFRPVQLIRKAPSFTQTAEARRLLGSSRRPIILAGGGSVWSDAGEQIRSLAQRLDCPVITTLNGKGIIDERDPISLGHGRSVRAKAAVQHADLMLAVGCRFTEVFTWFGKMTIPDMLIQIDIDPTQIGMNYQVKLGLIGDARETLGALMADLPARPSDWGECIGQIREMKPAHSEWLIDTLRAELPDNAIVFTDASEMAFRMQTDFPAYGPRTYFYPSNFITLGWGFPAAVGAAVARGDRPIVSVSGDGGFVMSAQELATAARYGLRVIAIVHNDSTYGAIKNLQRTKHEGRYHDTELSNPDFLTLAKAYGVPAARAHSANELTPLLRKALNLAGPFVIEVPDNWRLLRP